jgi:hypothetical protein
MKKSHLRSRLHVPHPDSPSGRTFNWSSIGLPHPDSPAGRSFDWASRGLLHPRSPAGKSVPWQTLSSTYADRVEANLKWTAPDSGRSFTMSRRRMTDRPVETAYTGPYVSGGGKTASGYSPYSAPRNSPPPFDWAGPELGRAVLRTPATEFQTELQKEQHDLGAVKHIDSGEIGGRAGAGYMGPYLSADGKAASGYSPGSAPRGSPPPSIGWDPDWVDRTFGTLPTESQTEEQQNLKLDRAAGKHVDPGTGGEVDDVNENSGAEALFSE